MPVSRICNFVFSKTNKVDNFCDRDLFIEISHLKFGNIVRAVSMRRKF